LSNIVSSSAIYYDPDPTTTIIDADKQLIDFHNATNLDDVDPQRLSPWIIRFELNGKKMIGRQMSIEHIDNMLHEKLSNDMINIVRDRDLQVLEKFVLRLRIPDVQADEEDLETVPMLLKDVEDKLLNDLTLKGFPEITKVAYSQESAHSKEKWYDKETGEFKITKSNWIIETDGVALKKIMAVDKVNY